MESFLKSIVNILHPENLLENTGSLNDSCIEPEAFLSGRIFWSIHRVFWVSNFIVVLCAYMNRGGLRTFLST
jgi:hypothetical protein